MSLELVNASRGHSCELSVVFDGLIAVIAGRLGSQVEIDLELVMVDRRAVSIFIRLQYHRWLSSKSLSYNVGLHDDTL